MSQEDICIYRDYQIINRYVQLPPNEETNKTSLDDITAEGLLVGSVIVELSSGSGRETGSRFGKQRFLRLPAVVAGDCCDRPDDSALYQVR